MRYIKPAHCEHGVRLNGNKICKKCIKLWKRRTRTFLKKMEETQIRSTKYEM